MKSSAGDQESVVRGVVRRVTFRNPTNGYSVLKLSVSEKAEAITVVGTCLDAQVGTNLLVRGTYVNHPKFGKQLSANTITPIEPESKEGIEKYLGSGLIKGIGPKTAKKLVDAFGTKTLDVIQQEPEKLVDVAGLGKSKADLIMQGLAEQAEIREVMRFLVEHNISNNLAGRIYERYNKRAIEVLKQDPYLLARQMRGVGFATADTIAMNIGLQPDSPQRLKAGIYYALEQAADEGHCHLNQATLAQRARALLGIGDELDLEPHLESLISENFIVRELEMLSLTQLYRAERFVAQFTAQRIAAEPHPIIEEQIIERCVAQAAQDLGLEFSPEQLRAVQYATHHPFLIITGGPGCGKTTLIRALSAVYDRANRRVLLAAPTGRAAQRMSQVCGMPAGTIHRLLRYDPHKHKFLHDSHNPLPGDVLIIDEASMLDINLARDLFAAIPGNCVLILVGDKDQLPSVGPGRVFADLLAVREVKSVALSHLFRRSEESSINSVAHMINSGITPEIPAPDGNTKTDAYFLPKTSADEAANLIESLVADQLPRKFGFELDDITVLTPSNRGPLGTNELNKRLQKRLNPENNALTQNQIMHGETCFRVGDRVCQRVNNYNLHEAGVFNGDNGIIYRVDPQNRKLLVELWDGRLIEYESGDISQLSLAYAVSVHRSQGSEIPCVVLALHESQYNLLERQLLYTGVTRAKKLLVVVGSKRALNIASRRTSSKQRCTYLRERIKEYLSNA